jgi:cell wall-associated NlpC family hydrolase
MSADDILTAARACLGTPFRHQGRHPGKALDCAGLVVAVAAAIGAEHVDFLGYGRHPANGLLQAALDAQPCLLTVMLADRQPGDILLMRFLGEPQHLAIDAGDNVIHSYQAVGQVCEHRLDAAWQSRIVAVYRFRGLA